MKHSININHNYIYWSTCTSQSWGWCSIMWVDSPVMFQDYGSILQELIVYRLWIDIVKETTNVPRPTTEDKK